MTTIVTIRFNNETWTSNNNYRIKKNIKCIYATPFRLTSNIEINSYVYVIEMNNSNNQIIGIGLIKNKIQTNKYYKVQNDKNFNRYIYIGNHHIPREIILNFNPQLVFILEEILFKGKTHSKRGSGLTKIPEKILKFDICKNIDIKNEIKELFIYIFREKKQS